MAEAGGDQGDIKEWRSILTLVVFVVTNTIVLFPFHAPLYIPRRLYDAFLSILVKFRAIPETVASSDYENDSRDPCLHIAFKKLRFPLNFITAPIIADLLLLAVSAIGRKEVKDGTIGTAHIHPLDIMLFFITLAYIAISIDASGLIRWLAFKVLGWGGDVGHRLFFYLYAFFFSLGSFIGNDPIILSGTAFLAYMTRVSKNITDPRAWIYSQFAVANISSAILVSSNPTNLVLAGAFNIKFIVYTANMVVPAVVTGIGLFPFLLYIVFNEPGLIPPKIDRWTLPEPENPDSAPRQPVNPNIPNARGPDARLIVNDEGEEMESNLQLSLEELLNPFLDKGGAAFGAVVMAATLITVLALNAASTSTGQYPVFYVTLPAAFIVFAWDFFFDWSRRDETRKLAREGRERIERERSSRLSELAENTQHVSIPEDVTHDSTKNPELSIPAITRTEATPRASQAPTPAATPPSPPNDHTEAASAGKSLEKSITLGEGAMETQPTSTKPTTLVSLCKQCFKWLHETFPTVIAVFSHLPLALVPFAFAMFVLVQALVSKGWVRVFAYGWGHWVGKTGSIGAVGGMGFLSVILCNFAGTNIGTTILLSRVIQEWYQINEENGSTITVRTFWATVYSMAVGVNYGAFSTAFSASLAGLLWRDILKRKFIDVLPLEFARYNFPIIAISMTIGCAVLIGEVYIVYDKAPYIQN